MAEKKEPTIDIEITLGFVEEHLNDLEQARVDLAKNIDLLTKRGPRSAGQALPVPTHHEHGPERKARQASKEATLSKTGPS